MIVNDLDLGPSHPWPTTQQGQVMGSAVIEGSRTIVWPRGAQATKQQDVTFWISAWQALGGQSAFTLGAAQFLVKQLEELSADPDLQPAYIQWTATARPGAFSQADPHDGWYVIEDLRPNYRKYIVNGIVECKATLTLVAPATPSSLAARYDGAALASTFSQAATPLVAYPVGSTVVPAAALSRTGAEGAIPYSILPLSGGVNPAPFVRPGTIAGLFTGQCRAFDTINTGSNPVPTAGAFVNANWLEIKGTQHDFTGDLVVTNGLLLLLYQVGQGGTPTVYFWNTSLATPAWQNPGFIEYRDNAATGAILREINLEKVGLEEVRLRLRMSTSNSNWAEFRQKLPRGQYLVYQEFQPLTQSNTYTGGFDFPTVQAQKILFSDSAIADFAVQSGTGLAPGTLGGWAAAFGQTANGPLIGFLYQNAPGGNQGFIGSATDVQPGDNSGPAQGTFRLYGFFACPWVNAPNLQAEGESGTLGTGWSSVADAAASAGNTAKAASGTASGNADLFGVSYVPTAGGYDVWFRVRVTSAAGSTAEMGLQLWDATSSTFVVQATLAANAASTSYVWVRVNSSLAILTAGHNIQFRAVVQATLGTDWFIDEAVLAPRQSATLGQGNFPGDLFSQFLFDRTVNWARG